MSVTVKGCPCGKAHQMASDSWAQLQRVTKSLNPLVQVTDGKVDTWLVPRLYIACHGLVWAELPVLAERYGFEKLAT